MPTTFTLAPSEDDVFKALGDFLQDILPPSQTTPTVVPFEVIVGQENRVPEPTQANYVVMVPLRMPRLATNRNTMGSNGLQATTVQNAQVVIQMDIHGPEAFNNSNRVSALFFDPYATEFFESYPNIGSLFASDPRQGQFVDGEKQYEDRYIVEANLQVNFTLTRVTQSATTLTVDIVDVETDPDNWPNSTATATAT